MRLIITYSYYERREGVGFVTTVVELPPLPAVTPQDAAWLYLHNEYGAGVALLNVWPTTILEPDKTLKSVAHWKGVLDGYQALLG